jgi:peptidoglycan glycosyltransferase
MHLIVELIKYLMILMIGVYSYYSFGVFRHKNKRKQDKSYGMLTLFVFAIHFIGYFTLYFQNRSDKILLLYGGEAVLFFLILAFYQAFYPKLSKLLLRNMLMLLAIGLIVLARLSFDKAIRQVVFTFVTCVICIFVPVAIRRFSWLKRFGWSYGIVGILILLVVLFAGTKNYGATNWLNIAGFSFQPSELVKLLFVFCIASMFREGTNFKRVITVSVVAGANVLILVIQKDLGGALIFFVTYIFMLYAATSKPIYLLSGLAGGSVAALVAYKLFDHVKVRVMAWRNPFAYIDNEGYQISQSLFAIGTGGWFGMGLNQGLPTSIPVVDSDFVFSAIAEEFGGLFSICIILIYINCFIMMMNIALKLEDSFYRLLAMGFAVMFCFQVILSIGGVIKFIPSTGVTLPLVSSGGSSIFATILMFMILQGIYLKGNTQTREDETGVPVQETEERK